VCVYGSLFLIYVGLFHIYIGCPCSISLALAVSLLHCSERGRTNGWGNTDDICTHESSLSRYSTRWNPWVKTDVTCVTPATKRDSLVLLQCCALAHSRSFALSPCRVVTLSHSRAVALSLALSRFLALFHLKGSSTVRGQIRAPPCALVLWRSCFHTKVGGGGTNGKSLHHLCYVLHKMRWRLKRKGFRKLWGGGFKCNTSQLNAIRCSVLQHTASVCCNTLRHAATRCNTHPSCTHTHNISLSHTHTHTHTQSHSFVVDYSFQKGGCIYTLQDLV